MSGEQAQNKRVIDRVRYSVQGVDPKSPQGQQLLHRIGLLLSSEMKLNIRRQGLIDQGFLLNSIGYEVDGNTVEVGSYGVVYAKVHEFGTVGKGGTLPDIRPRNAKYLTIPIYTEYKKVTARQIFDNLTYVRVNGNPMLYDKAAGRFAYYLAKKVSIPPRPFMRPAVETQTPNILRMIRETIANDR